MQGPPPSVFGFTFENLAPNARVTVKPEYRANYGEAGDRWNLLNPGEPPRVSYVSELLEGQAGPVVAATDYMKAYADQIREFVPQRYRTLGTDGFGRSDSREQLREFFEVNSNYICLAALTALVDDGEIDRATLNDAVPKLNIDPDKPNPVTV